MRSSLRALSRWFRRTRARRQARLASLTRADEHLMEVAKQAREAGGSDDSWRHALPVPRRGGGGM